MAQGPGGRDRPAGGCAAERAGLVAGSGHQMEDGIRLRGRAIPRKEDPTSIAGVLLLKRRQWTLKGLMIAIALIGVGLAALVRPSKGWTLVLPLFLLIMELTAILGVVLRRG